MLTENKIPKLLAVFLVPIFYLFCFKTFAQSTLTPQQIDNISRSVVQVSTMEKAGSGSIVGNSNIIITNYHVIEGQNFALISILKDPNDIATPAFLAEIVAYTEDYDVALLQVVADIDGNYKDETDLQNNIYWPGTSFPALQYSLYPSTQTRGDPIYTFSFPAIGNNELIFTTGIINSVRHDNYMGKRIPIWYRTNAEISSGSSGGIAVNQYGQAIGIATSMYIDNISGRSVGNILAFDAVIAALEAERFFYNFGLSNDNIQNIHPETNIKSPRTGSSQTLILNSGMHHDPFRIGLSGGGDNNAANLSPGCVGFIADSPNIQLQWSGRTGYIRMYFESNADVHDATLIVKKPSGEFICNDDAHQRTLNPLVDIFDSRDGQYKIWIGNFNNTGIINGELTITEFDHLSPR